mmetsp:Transcript_4643/g.6083  ORF Transcript_4643/g.6083 Transcript_4643/m.6083 type:complete len:407 (+) Transcript_4643:18-1238(+)
MPERLASIFRNTRFVTEKRSPSPVEDIPRLHRASSDNAIITSNEEERIQKAPRRRSRICRHLSMEHQNESKKTIKFDPTVWVYEYRRPKEEQESIQNGDIWYTPSELSRLRVDAIARIRMQQRLNTFTSAYSRTHKVAPHKSANHKAHKVLFTNPALSLETNGDDDGHADSSPEEVPKRITSPLSSPSAAVVSNSSVDPNVLQQIIQSELQTILIVDRYDLFLGLFAKGLKSMLPHVQIAVAHTAEEAVQIIDQARSLIHPEDGGATHGFDMIITEERLHSSDDGDGTQKSRMSGSDLIEAIAKEEKIMDTAASTVAKLSSSLPFSYSWGRWGFQHTKSHNTDNEKPRLPLLIGVSANPKEDGDRLLKAGSNFVWGKPPPTMNDKLRNELLVSLLKKRGKDLKTLL